MNKPFKLLAILLTTGALTGCLGVEGPAGAAPDGQQQAFAASERGNVPSADDPMTAAKEAFRNRNFGLAEQRYRGLVESAPDNIEAWLGLAATHDELGRFDLADREYAQVQKKSGITFELHNNRGMSYMMRGDLVRARRELQAAQRLSPDDSFVLNNLRELDEKSRRRG